MTTVLVAPGPLRAWTDDAAGATALVQDALGDAATLAAGWHRGAGFEDPGRLLDRVADVVARLLHLCAVADLVADEAERLDQQFTDGPLVALARRSAGGWMNPADVAPLLTALDGADRVHALWQAVPRPTVAALRRQRPDTVAGLDGIDLASRDAANRRLIRRRMAELESDIARQQSQAVELAALDDVVGLTSADMAMQRTTRLHQRLAALASILAADLVLLWDPSGDGRAVVSWGDPTTASHVATFVPGMSHSLSTFGSVMRDAVALHRHATDLSRRIHGIAAPRAQAPNASHTAVDEADVATVAWLGHDAPSGWLWGVDQAGTDHLARTQAPLLVSWTRSLRLVNPDVVHTIVAHSYGSVVAAQGLRSAPGRTGVDRLVVLGSPGLGSHIASAADLHLDDGELLVASASGDIVPRLPVLGPDPARFAAAVTLPVGPTNTGHSSYLVADSLGLDNVARAVLGLQPGRAAAW